MNPYEKVKEIKKISWALDIAAMRVEELLEELCEKKVYDDLLGKLLKLTLEAGGIADEVTVLIKQEEKESR